MKELIEYLVGQLIGEGKFVDVQFSDGDKEYIDVNVTVEKEDIGKIIGKQGKIAKAIRTIVKAASYKEGKKYNVIINERE